MNIDVAYLKARVDDHFRNPAGEIKPFISRHEAARFLTALGLTIASATLAKKAVNGDGPPFRPWQNQVVYGTDDLLAWAAEKLGNTIVNTAQRKVAPTERRQALAVGPVRLPET